MPIDSFWKNNRARFTLVLIAAIALWSSGCSMNLPKYQALGNGFRVLAIQANQPERSLGQAVTLTVYLTDLAAQASRNFSWNVETCWDPGVAFGVTPSCSADASKQSFSGTWNGLLAAPLYTGTVGGIGFSVPASFPTTSTVFTQFNGVAYLAVLTVTLPDGSTVKAFKRIIVSTRVPQNTNPTLTGFTRDGVAQASLPTTTGTLVPTVGAGAETYQAYSNFVLTDATETLTITWFLSEGTMGFDRTVVGSTNTYTIPAPETYAQQLLIGVIRDGRGGVGWTTLVR